MRISDWSSDVCSSDLDDVGLTFVTGGQRMALRVVPDPAKLALYRVPLNNLIDAVSQANRAFPAGTVREGGPAALVIAGQTLSAARELSQLNVRSASSEERRVGQEGVRPGRFPG